MHNIYKKIFEILDQYKYCVLRNPEGLPFKNLSNDIDILIQKSDYRGVVAEVSKELSSFGYSRVETSSFYGIKCFTFYSYNKTLEAIKLDFFFSFCGGGLHYLSFDEIYNKTYLNKNGIRVLEPDFESFLNALKTFLSGGKLKEKYYESLKKSDINHICDEFNYLGDVIKDIKKCRNGDAEFKGRRKVYIKQIFKSNIRRIGFKSTLFGIFNHAKEEYQRISTNNRFVVICGIDGSGKSTLLEKSLQDSELHFRTIKDRFILGHHRPRCMPHISDLLMKRKNDNESSVSIHENPRSGKVSGKLVSTIKFIYYLIDYSIMFRVKHYNQLRRDKIIIYDRYYFDFLVDPERSALNLNDSLVKLAYRFFVPKPSLVIYVTVPPELAYKRKGELSISESKTLQQRYLDNKEFWSENQEIVNLDLDESIEKFRAALVYGISEEIGGSFVK